MPTKRSVLANKPYRQLIEHLKEEGALKYVNDPDFIEGNTNPLEKPIHMSSGDYDELIKTAIDMQDVAWAKELNKKKQALVKLENELRGDIL